MKDIYDVMRNQSITNNDFIENWTKACLNIVSFPLWSFQSNYTLLCVI